MIALLLSDRTARPFQGKRSGYTLVEAILVTGLILLIAALAAPRLANLLAREQLPGSAKQLRTLLTLVQAHAQFDGNRYRVRFADVEGETDALGGKQQPRIEREDDPIEFPEVFNLVTSPWAVGETLLGNVRCSEIRHGRPTIEKLKHLRETRRDTKKRFGREFENYEEQRLPLFFEPDGTTNWATFVLTEAPEDVLHEDVEEHPTIELILEGLTGLAWLQRPFFDEELDLFEEKGWPAALRQDFLVPRVLTENDVLELHEMRARGANHEDSKAIPTEEPGSP